MKTLFHLLFLCVISIVVGNEADAQWLSSSGTQSVYLSTTTYPYSVGIGAGPNNTQSILAKLHVANEALFSTNGMTVGPNLGIGSVSIAGSGTNVGLNLWKRTLTTLADNSTAGNRWMWYNPDGSVRLYTGTTGDVMTALSGGNIGIGFTSPAYKLHVNGDLKIKNNIYFDNSFSLIDSASGKYGIKSSAASGLQFFSNSTTARATIDPNGNFNLANNMNLILTTGKIGVGTSTPAAALEVVSQTSGIRVSSGIATSPTYYQLARASAAEAGIYLASGANVGSTLSTAGDVTLADWVGDIILAGRNDTSSIRFTTMQQDVERMTLQPNGNFGIGTTSPTNRLSVIGNTDISGNVSIGTAVDTFKLKVKGTIKAKEIVVDTTGWADYVFSDTYELKSLEEVESTIKTEKHLPGIPTAAEIGKRGIHISEMQTKLLEKIEELTLYVIGLKKDNASLRKRIEQIEK